MSALPSACRVVLPLPAPQPYSYSLPPVLADRVVPGARVVVPVRGRTMVGVVVSTADEAAADLKPVLLAPDPAPLVPEPLLALAGWVARYYATPLGLALRAMLPGPLWGESRMVATMCDAGQASGGAGREVIEALEKAGGRATASRLGRVLGRPVWDALQRLARAGAVTLETEAPELGPAAGAERVMVLTRALPSLLARTAEFGRAERQRAAYEALDDLGGDVAWRHLVRGLGFSPAVLRALVERGLARVEEREQLRDPFAGITPRSAPPPSAAQREAIAALEGVPAGGAALLFGVTGSGKTLAYLEAVRAASAAGRGAIVLVPEIGLTPQTIARVRGVLGPDVAVLHSALSDAERADAWRAVAAGGRRVVVGARSAVFAPFRDLGAIVVDEEHDGSYKNGEAPRYHARQVALARARLQGARVILASATPALETWCGRDRLTLVRLPRRVEDRPLPPVRLLDLSTVERVPEAGAVPWSRILDAAVEARLAAGEQVLLLLNRRGLAHFLQCTGCGYVWDCPHCSIALTVHHAPARLRCHYCGYDAAVPAACGQCGGAAQRTRGVGTQELERWLGTRYPAARIARMDADTTGTKWSHRQILDAVEQGAVDVLFGTQMIAKGLDFPNVTLVGVVDADTGLHLPDFRAAERTFQLIAQVAGRAGRGPRGGDVLVQTRSAAHYALQTAAAHDYEAFAGRELAARQRPAYPPVVGLVNVLVSGPADDVVAGAAVDAADWVRAAIAARAPGVELVGPAPAPLARLKGRWRWHFLLRSADRALLGRLTRYVARRAPQSRSRGIRLIVDRDPVSLL
ncbi:MAG TPA: primosomal protein N' [Gemmatimonadales bacterium]|nr:primosomal protein N' [Gemmatimonadales bacterium]